MTPDRYELIQQNFLRICELQSEQRSQALDDLDPDLQADVASLLRSHDECGGFLESAPPNPDSPTSSFPGHENGGGRKVIGQYRLLQKIGEGGHGSVYMAEQQGQIRRKVALKLIKPGMDSKQVLARFRAEQQALAMMDHSSIARVFDAGVSESGTPYFVMELVKGVPIHEFCDQTDATLDERLKLYLQVCDAVHHAHRKGIIHRDIKPSNVLVTMGEGDPITKVIDFGIAKALDQRLTEQTLYTEYGQMIGTLEYMSPEQSEMSAVDIDTRSDVYSLGVLLYQLLTGETPISRDVLLKNGVFEIPKQIRETEPGTPSDRITARQRQLTRVDRDSKNSGLNSLPSGELDWIALKALEKDRRRRYESVLDLARDVQRFIEGEPVEAHPPSLAYKLSKAVRRHWGAFSMAGVLILGALVGLLGLGIGLNRARTAAKIADGERASAVEAREWADSSRRELAETVYSELVESAWRSATQQKNERAMEMLERCLPEMRGWEWALTKSRIRDTTAFLAQEPDRAAVSEMDVHQDRMRAATVLQNGRVEIWDLDSGSRVGQIDVPSRANVARWSSTGDALFVGTSNGRVHYYRVDTWSQPPVATLQHGHGGIYDIRVTRCEEDSFDSVAICSGSGVVERFFVQEDNYAFESVQKWKVNSRIAALNFDEDGTLLAAGFDGKLYHFGTDDAPEATRVSDSSIYAVIPISDGFVAMANDAALRLTEDEAIDTLIQTDAGTSALASNGADLVALGGGDGTLLVKDVSDDRPPVLIGSFGAAIKDMNWVRSREQFLVALSDGRVLWTDLAPHRNSLEATAGILLPRHSMLVTFKPNGRMRCIDFNTGAELHEAAAHSRSVWGVSCDAKETILASVSEDQRLRVWDLPDFQLRYTKKLAWGVRDVCVAPDGSWIATAPPPDLKNYPREGTVSIRDAETGDVLRTLSGHQNWVLKMDVTPDGKTLATSGEFPTTRLWNVDDGQLLAKLEYASRAAAPQIVFAPNGEALYLGHRDGWVTKWNLTDPSPAGSWQAFGDIISGLKVTADGRVVATSQSSHQLKVYDFQRNRRLASLDMGLGLLLKLDLAQGDGLVSLVGQDRGLTIYRIPDSGG